jgi:DNA-binding response OmpR family regulator
MHIKPRILLAEDEPALGQIVKESLETRDYIVNLARDGEEALRLFQEERPHVMVLDVMMPGKDGFGLTKELRKKGEEVPVIFLTAKSQPSDVVEGFRSGGDDYLKKPFSMEELIVRIENLLQRKPISEAFSIGKFLFDHQRQVLTFPGKEPLELTHRESELLFYLCKSKNEVLDRSFILKKIWGDDDFFSARSMDVFISKLRKKLKQDPNVKILNVRGYGYKLVV